MLRSLILAALTAAAFATPALGGPPWIAVESPANPLDPETRGAAFVVRVYHHATPASYTVVGRAEGLVGGERRSLALNLKATSKPGVFTVPRQWPGEGVWTLVISVAGHGSRPEATAIVEIGPTGQVAGVRVPVNERGFPVGGDVASVEIEQGLRARAARLARGPGA